VNIVVTNEAMSFSWKGFKLNVPDKALPEGISEYPVNIKASQMGQFELPEAMRDMNWLVLCTGCMFQEGSHNLSPLKCSIVPTSATLISYTLSTQAAHRNPYLNLQIQGCGWWIIQLQQ